MDRVRVIRWTQTCGMLNAEHLAENANPDCDHAH